MNNLKTIYISEVEASERYCYSRGWFQRERWKGTGPPYLKIRGRILYPIEATDAWFSGHGLQNSTSSNVTANNEENHEKET